MAPTRLTSSKGIHANKRRKLNEDGDSASAREISSSPSSNETEASSDEDHGRPPIAPQQPINSRHEYSLRDLDGSVEDEDSEDEEPIASVPAPSTSRLSIKPRTDISIEPKRPTGESASLESHIAPKIPFSERPNVSDFASLGVIPAIVSSLGVMSIRKPTPVQAACIPMLLAGKDCVGNAKTGQGKTIAFSVPILQQLAKDPYGIFALILTPTRELAFQISEQLAVIGGPLDIRTTVVVGGMDMTAQMIALNSRPHVVVATPGRLVDLLHESAGEWSLAKIKFLVLDEADRLLGTAFASELAAIFAKVPEQRQTCLFTATLTPTIESLALSKPRPGKSQPFVYRDSDTSSIETVETLKQQFILCPSHVREVYLYHLLCNPPESIIHLRRDTSGHFKSTRKLKDHEISAGGARQGGRKRPKVKDSDFDVTQPPPTIIFVQTSHSAAYLATVLKELGFRTTALHSKMGQKERLASLNMFRAFAVPILICTDVGARGLDMDGVGMVVNWDLPRNPKDSLVVTETATATVNGRGEAIQTAEETYVHRVGRTARMGRGGVAVSFVTERRWDEGTLKRIEERIHVNLTELKMDEDLVLEKLNLVSSAKRVAVMELEQSGFGKREERHKEIKARRNATED